jgi:HemY protein
MLKLLWRLALLIAVGLAFAWLADRPGTVNIKWMGRDIEMSVMVAAVALALALAALYFIWQFTSRLWRSPRTARDYWRFRKHKKAYEALSRGLIAASAGDAQAASRLAASASSTLHNEPLVNVLAAQAAQLKGDRAAVKQAFEEMAKHTETEVLGLRGLFNEAKLAGDFPAAAGFAEKALALNPRLAWASSAMLHIQSARKDWAAAAATIATQGKSGLLPRDAAAKKRAILLTAEALKLEDGDKPRALACAVDAFALDQSLVPAALVAARCHLSNGSTRKALRILRDAWAKAPHPDLAETVANAKSDGNAEERFERVRDLVGATDENIECAVALARAAASARRWDVARKALEPHIASNPQARICALMAQIEDAADDKGRSREWLARALNAPRDPMWVADGVASPRWTPVSPVTGEIVFCEWKAPYEPIAVPDFAEAAPAITAVTIPQIQGKPAEPVPILPRPPDDPGTDDPELRG